MSNFPFLSVLTVAPLVGALVVAFLPRTPARAGQAGGVRLVAGWCWCSSVVMWVTLQRRR